MLIQVQKDVLVRSVQEVMKAVSSRTTIPILTGIKLVAHEDGLTLTGSDSDISIQSFIPCEEAGDEIVDLKKPGSVVLHAKYFSEIVKKLPTDTVEISVDENRLTKIKSGKSEFSLNGLDADEYPQLPSIDENSSLKLSGDLLKNVIRQTVYAVSTSETRPILTGVNWKLEGNQLLCIATDSHRLAQRKVTIPTESLSTDLNFNIVIPGKSLHELSKIVDDQQQAVEIIITDYQVLFKTKHILFFTRLLEGNYPDTTKLIPHDMKTNILVDSKSLLQSIDRASLLARDGNNNVVKLDTLENEKVLITSNSPEIGKVTEEVVCETIDGEDLKISFSAKYMMDALRAVDGADVRISFTGAMRPFLIKNQNDDTILQLVLPVRTY